MEGERGLRRGGVGNPHRGQCPDCSGPLGCLPLEALLSGLWAGSAHALCPLRIKACLAGGNSLPDLVVCNVILALLELGGSCPTCRCPMPFFRGWVTRVVGGGLPFAGLLPQHLNQSGLSRRKSRLAHSGAGGERLWQTCSRSIRGQGSGL